jgi:hypothetical protein
MRRLPFVVRLQEGHPICEDCRLFELLSAANIANEPTDDYAVFLAFLEEAFKQFQPILDSDDLSHLGSADGSMLLKAFEVLGLLIGIAYQFGEGATQLRLPAVFCAVLVGLDGHFEGSPIVEALVGRSFILPDAHFIYSIYSLVDGASVWIGGNHTRDVFRLPKAGGSGKSGFAAMLV